MAAPDASGRLGISLVGGGRGGAALLDLILEYPPAQLLVVVDPDAGAPALDKARALVLLQLADHAAVAIGNARLYQAAHDRARDCGRVINPMIVEGQVHGGTAQGIGEALLEAMVYGEDGQCQTATLMDYLLPTTADVPSMIVDHIESPSIDAAEGFKGIGEGGVIGAVPAVTNAVADALAGLGVNVNRIPLTPDRVLALIEGAASRPGA